MRKIMSMSEIRCGQKAGQTFFLRIVPTLFPGMSKGKSQGLKYIIVRREKIRSIVVTIYSFGCGYESYLFIPIYDVK